MGLDCKHNIDKKTSTQRWGKDFMVREDQEYCETCGVWESSSIKIIDEDKLTTIPCKITIGTGDVDSKTEESTLDAKADSSKEKSTLTESIA